VKIEAPRGRQLAVELASATRHGRITWDYYPEEDIFRTVAKYAITIDRAGWLRVRGLTIGRWPELRKIVESSVKTQMILESVESLRRKAKEHILSEEV